MPRKQALTLCAALLVRSHGMLDCAEGDSTSLLQKPVRRSKPLQAHNGGVHLLETARTIISKVNAGDDPSGCGAASDATRTAVEEVLPAIFAQHTHWSNQINIAAEAVDNCASQGGDLVQQGIDLQTVRANHQTCRLVENGLEACQQYGELRNSLGNRCFAFPDDEGGYPEAVQRARDELDVAFTQAQLLQQSCNSAREAIAAQDEECASAQHRFEEDYCAYRANCAGVQACRADTEETYRRTEAEALAALETLHSEYQVLRHVQCLLGHADQALEQSTIVNGDVISACSEPASTDGLTIHFPAFDAVTTCASNIIYRPPCEIDFFFAEYHNLPQRAAIQAACIECPALQHVVPVVAEPETELPPTEPETELPPTEPETELPYHLEPQGSHTCSTSSVSAEECLEAVRLFAPEGQVPVLHQASWSHVPTGCSTHGNHNAYFNTRANGVNDGDFIPVCNGPEAVLSNFVAHVEPQGSHTCSTSSVSAEECLEAVGLFHPRGQGFPVLHQASWSHLPTGCSTHGNHQAYFNTHANGVNDGDFIPVCNGPEAVLSNFVAHVEPPGSHSCSTSSVSAEECLEAVGLFNPRGQGFPVLHSSGWAHVPTGCSKHRTNHAAYFNTRANGVNDGDFMPVCSGPEAVPSDIVAHLEAQGSHTCSTSSVSAEECLEAVRTSAPEGEFPVLHSSGWAHVPTGCSKHPGNHDAYFNTRANGVNDGNFIPVCNGLADETEQED